jgi:hypothetical protein
MSQRYIFAANGANPQDIAFLAGKFVVTVGSGTDQFYLDRLANFLNNNGRRTGLYFCQKITCNVLNEVKAGHYHVVFEAEDKDDALAVLRQFLPNYNCDQVTYPAGFDRFLCELQLIRYSNP